MLDPSGFLLGDQTQPPHPHGGGWARSLPPALPGLSATTTDHIDDAPSTTTSGMITLTNHIDNHENKTRPLSSTDLHHLASFLERVTSGPDDASSTSSAFTSPILTNGTSSPPLSNSVTASPLFGTVAMSDSFEPLFPPAHSNVLASLPIETKKADSGDFPFDIDPASLGHTYELLAFPAFESNAGSNATATGLADPVAFDNLLESPLGLSESGGSSTDPSPLSDFLASPLFSSVSGYESAMQSATMSELPLPSPSGASLAAAGAAQPPSNLAWFPPHPSTSSLLYDSIMAAASQPPSASGSTATILRELPPAPSPNPPHPTPLLASLGSSFSPQLSGMPLPAAPSRRPSSSSTPAAATASASAPQPKRAPTGFRQVELLPLDAPIQSRNSVLPSATSRKRKTAGAERALAKRGRTETPALEDLPSGSPALADADADDLPADIVAAVERKRLQNTLSARKSRARKQARLQELETENESLRARIAELEARLAQS
ncbi:hypothetical protein JCM10908_000995 [Rhodotorula pacifica]|uniref:bZIP transcription factor n=1 Tax=Rhodotorula pacifica TaxID=1495444 RepID=UPI0031801F19